MLRPREFASYAKGRNLPSVSKNKDIVVALREIAAGNVVVSKTSGKPSEENDLLSEGQGTDNGSGFEEAQVDSEG